MNTLRIYGSLTTHIYIDVIAIITVIIVAFIYFATTGFVFKYLTKIKSKDSYQFLLGFHIITSVLIALIVPNNFLANYDLFKNLFIQNSLWIPATMIGILFINTILIGIVLNLLCNYFFKEKKENN